MTITHQQQANNLLDLDIPIDNMYRFWTIMDNICAKYNISEKAIKARISSHILDEKNEGCNYRFHYIFVRQYLPKEADYILPMIKNPENYDIPIVEGILEKITNMKDLIEKQLSEDIDNYHMKFFYVIVLDMCELNLIKTFKDLFVKKIRPN